MSKSEEEKQEAIEAAILKQQQEARKQELKELENKKRVKSGKVIAPEEGQKELSVREVLEGSLRDKSVAKGSDFEDAGKKTDGVSHGNLAQAKVDKHKFMKKHAFKDQRTAIAQDQKENIKIRGQLRMQHSVDRGDLITEYLVAPLYNRMLYDRAPSIELVVGDKELQQDPKTRIVTIQGDKQNPDIHIRSKFFDNFQTLGEFSGNKRGGGGINGAAQQLKSIIGFEKVIAACLLNGECDYHAGNLGVVKRDNQNIVVKIDHGRSGLEFFTSEQELRGNLQDNFELFEYQNINFNLSDFKTAVDEMVKISDSEVENLIRSRQQKLAQAFNAADRDNVKTTADDFIENIKKQREVMKELSSTLAVVSLIPNKSPEWKNGGWLQELGGQDIHKYLGKQKITSIDMKAALALTEAELKKCKELLPNSLHVQIDKAIAIKSALKEDRLRNTISSLAKWEALEKPDSKVLEALSQKIKDSPLGQLTEAIKVLDLKIDKKIVKMVGDSIVEKAKDPNISNKQLIDLMVTLKDTPLNKDGKNDFEKQINELEKLRLEKSGQKLALGEDSKFYKLLMSGNEKAIALLIQKMSQMQAASQGEQQGANNPNIEAILQNAPVKLWDKIAEISDKIEKTKDQKEPSFRGKITLFWNGAKKLIGLGVSDKEIQAALAEFNQVASQASEQKAVTSSKLTTKTEQFAKILTSHPSIIKELSASAQAPQGGQALSQKSTASKSNNKEGKVGQAR